MGLEQHESKYKITEFSFWGECPFKILNSKRLALAYISETILKDNLNEFYSRKASVLSMYGRKTFTSFCWNLIKSVFIVFYPSVILNLFKSAI